jgi:hypothetical protein
VRSVFPKEAQRQPDFSFQPQEGAKTAKTTPINSSTINL